jgi:hypothetical protein
MGIGNRRVVFWRRCSFGVECIFGDGVFQFSSFWGFKLYKSEFCVWGCYFCFIYLSSGSFWCVCSIYNDNDKSEVYFYSISIPFRRYLDGYTDTFVRTQSCQVLTSYIILLGILAYCTLQNPFIDSSPSDWTPQFTGCNDASNRDAGTLAERHTGNFIRGWMDGGCSTLQDTGYDQQRSVHHR